MKLNNLTDEEKIVILGKHTEKPFINEYDNFYKKGTYVCRQCDNPLYSSKAKFDSQCGWPSFDDCFKDSIEKVLDEDGIRIEIVCAVCKGHLGHIFKGEKYTKKNTRHCVNSVSIKFIPDK